MADTGKLKVIISTADRSRRAEVTLPTSTTVDTLLAECRKNWALPTGEDFAVRDTRQNVQLRGKDTLGSAGVADGTELQLFPLLEAGWR
jgi:hypothetical protein